MNELLNSHNVQQIKDKHSNIWYNGNDVCRIFELSNAYDIIKCNIDGKNRAKMNLGKESIRYVNEFGVYSLLLMSESSSAKNFKSWLSENVLPSIVNKGYYDVNDRKKIHYNTNKNQCNI
jgi:anti-repressor protein